MTKVLLFNGAKGSGKSIAIDYLIDTFYINHHIVYRECKDQVHKLTPLLFNVNENDYWFWYSTREHKEVPKKEFKVYLSVEEANKFKEIIKGDIFRVNNNEYHLSVRQAMIYVSEVICKPSFGDEYFGQLRADSITRADQVVVDSSCGFIEELYPLKEKFKDRLKDVTVIRVHREGCNFSGDSRKYLLDSQIESLGFQCVDIYNDSSEEEFLNKVKAVYLGIIENKEETV